MKHSSNHTCLSGRQAQTKTDDYQTASVLPSKSGRLNKQIKHLSIILLTVISCSLSAQKVYRTQIFDPNIKTLQIGVNDDKYLLPIIELNGSDILRIRFDEMSHEAHSYGYNVLHCNADWTVSNLSTKST